MPFFPVLNCKSEIKVKLQLIAVQKNVINGQSNETCQRKLLATSSENTNSMLLYIKHLPNAFMMKSECNNNLAVIISGRRR